MALLVKEILFKFTIIYLNGKESFEEIGVSLYNTNNSYSLTLQNFHYGNYDKKSVTPAL
jgi:hypothetical protein